MVCLHCPLVWSTVALTSLTVVVLTAGPSFSPPVTLIRINCWVREEDVINENMLCLWNFFVDVLQAKKLSACARRMNITLRFLPVTFTKSRENSTFCLTRWKWNYTHNLFCSLLFLSFHGAPPPQEDPTPLKVTLIVFISPNHSQVKLIPFLMDLSEDI